MWPVLDRTARVLTRRVTQTGGIHRATPFRGPGGVRFVMRTRSAGLVAEQLANGEDVAPIFEEMGGEGVAQAVRGGPPGKARPADGLDHGALRHDLVQVAVDVDPRSAWPGATAAGAWRSGTRGRLSQRATRPVGRGLALDRLQGLLRAPGAEAGIVVTRSLAPVLSCRRRAYGNGEVDVLRSRAAPFEQAPRGAIEGAFRVECCPSPCPLPLAGERESKCLAPLATETVGVRVGVWFTHDARSGP